MIPNMKFYVISIVAIFAALGIGIYIGFTLDAQSFVVDQREDIASKLEERFDFQKEENEKLKVELLELEKENSIDQKYIDNTYSALIENKLLDKNILVVETNSDYMYSGIGRTLEEAGANISGVVTLKKSFTDEEKIKEFYEEYSLESQSKDLVSDLSLRLTDALLDRNNDFINELKEEGIIDIIGSIDSSTDLVVLAGGSLEDNSESIGKVDKNIVARVQERGLDIIGVEKSNVNYSYIDIYKSYKISTIDNIDSLIGKVSMIYTLDSRPGHYGIKQTADGLMPLIDSKNPENLEQGKENKDD